MLEAEGRNDGCASGGAVVRGEVGSIEGFHFHWICLIGGWGYTRSHRSICPSELRGRRTLAEAEAEAEAEAKRVVVEIFEEVKRREDKRYKMRLTPLLFMNA